MKTSVASAESIARDWPLMNHNITRTDLDNVIDFLNQDIPILTQSKKVREFENAWSEWLGVKYSVFVNSGSSANLLTMAILKQLKGEGEVIVPTLTWVSDIASVFQAGLTPVFVDINPRNLCMDIDQVLNKITDKTRAVFMTHVLGYNGLTDHLISELEARGIPLIEDTCESHGATFKGKRLGSYGWVSNFSFYYAHHLSTIEGGMVCTNDEEVYQAARMFRSHGMVRESDNPTTQDEYARQYPDLNPKFIFAYPAYNVRSTEINAVIGLSQLNRLDDNNKLRFENLSIFLSDLDSSKYYTEFDQEGSCNYAFTLVLRNPDEGLRDRVESKLDELKIEYRRGASGGGNQLRQPYLRTLLRDTSPNDYPVVDHVHFFGYYIGNFPELSQEKVRALCVILNAL